MQARSPAGPGGARGAREALGTAGLALIAVQILTGVLLATSYCPSPEAAAGSVAHVERLVASGALIRGLHVWGTSLLVGIVLVHAIDVFGRGAFVDDRRALWIQGTLLGLLILAQAFTGSVLPWDTRGQSAAAIAGELAATVPGVGPGLRRLVLGGEQPGLFTLTRFYALHALVLPASILALAGYHRTRARPLALDGAAAPCARVYGLDAAVVLGTVTTLLALAVRFAPPLVHPPGTAGAVTQARPDWYFLPLYHLLHLAPQGWIFAAGVLLPGALAAVVVLWPWIEPRPEGHRLVASTFAGLVMFAGAVLLVMALAGGSY